jgi:8-oxo-dGTP pyrophosphatase MutT (NUDIX family)
MELLLEGILEGILELILDSSLDAAGNKKAHWSIRLLASLVLLAVFSALLALGVLCTVSVVNEGEIFGAVVLGILFLFILVIFAFAVIRKMREIKAKNESQISKPEEASQGELWDLYTADGALSDTKISRGDVIPEGLYHLVCEVLLRHEDGDYLLMRRDPQKPIYGGYFEATAGGSALKGEDRLSCAKRELLEETGITPTSCEEIGRYASHDTIYFSFLCRTDCQKDSVTLQEGETVSYKWLSEKEFIAFLYSSEVIPDQKKRYAPYFKKMGYIE